MRNSMRCLAFVVVGLAGCASNGSNDPFALRNPFESERRFDPKSAPAANTQLATRAHAVGTALIAEAKADLPERPVIHTIGVKEPMIFHQRTGQIVLSDGLVERCATDDDLAAVICFELGKMAAEHSEKSPPRGDSDMPPAPRLTSDVVGGAYSADMTRLAEEAKFDRRVPRAGTRSEDAGREYLHAFRTQRGRLRPPRAAHERGRGERGEARNHARAVISTQYSVLSTQSAISSTDQRY